MFYISVKFSVHFLAEKLLALLPCWPRLCPAEGSEGDGVNYREREVPNLLGLQVPDNSLHCTLETRHRSL